MDWDTLWAAVAVMLVLEGLLPLLWPSGWRQTFTKLLDLNDGQLRFFGLTSIVLGLLTLLFVL